MVHSSESILPDKLHFRTAYEGRINFSLKLKRQSTCQWMQIDLDSSRPSHSYAVIYVIKIETRRKKCRQVLLHVPYARKRFLKSELRCDSANELKIIEMETV